MDGSSDFADGAVTTGTAGTTSSGGAKSIGSGGTPGVAGSSNQDGLPCDVRDILRERCATCHGATPSFTATFSLTTAAQVREHGEHILVRTAEDATQGRMPQAPFPPLTADERTTLHDYIKAGAPVSTCEGGMPPMASGGSSGTGGSPATPNNDPDVTCYNITARASAANDEYMVPTDPDYYRCFDYTPPWGNKKVQMVSARPIIDNSAVLHHWLLYNGEAPLQDGVSNECFGAHSNMALVAGWAPGGEAFEAPSDVGVELQPGGFSIELHYNNKIGPGETDASGVEVCVTEKLRPNVAAMHWLGTEQLNKLEAVGTCRPNNTGDVTILMSTPHMHTQGTHMKTVINRAGGGTDILHDAPFDFNNQISYKTPAVVKPGDTLTTTCTYKTPTPFGTGTSQEMCYNFVMAYPAGGLQQLIQVLRKYDCAGVF